MIRLMFAFFALMVASGCSPPTTGTAESGTAEANAEAAIQEAVRSWISAYEQSDAETVSNLYETDAMYAANTGEVLRGRDGIREGMIAWIARRPAGVQLDLEEQPLRFVFLGDSAHTVSRFVISAMPAGCSIDAGHALAVWRRQSDGRWLITTQLVNRDPQPPANACPRPASASSAPG